MILTDEVARRDSAAADHRADDAGLDPSMRIELWDKTAKVSFDKRVLAELLSLRFLEAHRHISILGPVGVGQLLPVRKGPVEVLEAHLRQIELVKPRVIVGLGTFAVQSLLKVKTPISKLRGVWHDFRGVRLMPTFHPAYLLRNPGDKRLVWADIQEVMKYLGMPIPRRGGSTQ